MNIFRGKTLFHYRGNLSISNLVAWKDSGLTITAGIVVDIGDTMEEANILVSHLSQEVLQSLASGEVDFDFFAANCVSLVDHPLSIIVESRLTKIEPSLENLEKLRIAIEECESYILNGVSESNMLLSSLKSKG